MRRLAPRRPPWRAAARTLWPLSGAAMLAGCAGIDAGNFAAVTSHERPALSGVHRSAHEPRRLSDSEGEVVVAAAIAAHEMRRP